MPDDQNRANVQPTEPVPAPDSANRRRGEIGIMRAFGIAKSFIATVFVLRGFLIGLIGAALACITGYGLCAWLATLTRADGSLKGIDLSLDPGELVALPGASGSGTSALLWIIGLLLQPTGGTIAIGGQRVDGWTESQPS